MTEPYLAVLFGLAINTLIVIGFGWKISRFLARIELKVDIMWTQYSRQSRTGDPNARFED